MYVANIKVDTIETPEPPEEMEVYLSYANIIFRCYDPEKPESPTYTEMQILGAFERLAYAMLPNS